MLSKLVVELLIAGCCVAVYWRKPGLRQPARRVMPYVLIAIGTLSLLLTLSDSSFADGNAGGRAASWRAALVLQSAAFLAAGLGWLCGAGRFRSGRPGWQLLLPPVLVLLLVLLDHGEGQPTGIGVALITVIAVIVTLALPAVAADLATLALIVLGVTGLVFVAWPPPIFAPAARAVPTPVGGLISPPPAPTIGAVSVPLELLASVQALAILTFALWLVPRTIGPRARALLRPAPDPELAGRVEQLTQTRADAVGSASAELRRVERDLHDGAQARLVALGMNLRAAERLIPTSPGAAIALVAEAREASSQALTELRDLVRGIYPPVLADRGLGDAVRALALDTPIRTDVDIDLPGRLEFPVESACYFAIAETLANAVKHSGARLVQIRIRYAADLLRIEVTDNGTGGADPARGTGLAGIERRLGTFDGILAVSSPPGGPTMIIMEVPCALSSQRISSS
jgi:signal transduction histidine kinase